MRGIRLRVGAITLACLFGGCKDRGAKIVVPAPVMHTPAHLIARRSIATPGALKSVRGIHPVAGGRIAILDPAAYRIWLYDTSGVMLS